VATFGKGLDTVTIRRVDPTMPDPAAKKPPTKPAKKVPK